MKLRFLFNKIFKMKPKMVTDYKDLEYIYIDTNNYSNVINNIYNSINHLDNNYSYEEIMDNLDYSNILDFTNTIHVFIVKDTSKYCIKISEIIYQYNLEYSIVREDDKYIISLSLSAKDIMIMIKRFIEEKIEDPIYNIILSNIENIIDERLLYNNGLITKEDVEAISMYGFSNLDFYYSDKRLLSGNVIDNKLHIYVIENHLDNYLKSNDLCQLPFSVNGTIFGLFNIIIAIDNVCEEIKDILLPLADNSIVVYNEEENKNRLILKLCKSNIYNIIDALFELINFNKEDNNKLNLVVDASIIYNFLEERYKLYTTKNDSNTK